MLLKKTKPNELVKNVNAIHTSKAVHKTDFTVYVKISSITNLAYTVSLPAVENKTWTLVLLVKKVDYDAKILDTEKKYFTASD